MSDQPFVKVAAAASGPVLLLCDHASNRVPDFVNGGDLGLSAHDMGRHIAYDVGAAGLTRKMAGLMGAPALLSNFSRLVIDPNRGADDPTLVMRLNDGSIIPANRHVDAAEVTRRRDTLYTPYHDAITAQIDQMQADGHTPHILSIHSFTKQFLGRPVRPWQAGILWDTDDRIARPLISALEAEGDLTVGDNQPYSGQLRGDCMYRHGTMRGLPHVLIEVRNDLIETPDGQAEWAARLVRLITPLIPVTGA